jgi:hypothetical protein
MAENPAGRTSPPTVTTYPRVHSGAALVLAPGWVAGQKCVMMFARGVQVCVKEVLAKYGSHLLRGVGG